MAAKHKIIYLYLALLCFLGIILIFIFGGYMGVYDTLSVTARELPQKFEADFWLQPYNQATIGVERGGKITFSYEVDNRQFSGYSASIEVSAWQNQQKIRDLVAQPLSVAAFAKQQVDWVVDTAQIVPDSYPAEQAYQFTVVIKRGEVERRIIIYVNAVPYVPKTAIPGIVPIPAPVPLPAPPPPTR